MKRVLSNINFIVKLSLKYTGMVFALFGFIEMFAPLSEMFDAKLSLIKK